ASARARAVESLREGTVRAPARVQLAGFEELTPLQEALVAALRSRGSSVAIARPRAEPRGRAVLVRPADERAELELAARWCRRLLLEDSSRRLAVVVTNLAARHAAVRMAFEEELTPAASLLPDAESQRGLFEVSYAPPLRERAVVACAFSLLRMLGADVSAEETSRLLRSPFLAAAEREQHARARFDASLRRRRVSRYPLAWLDEQARAEAARGEDIARLAAITSLLAAEERQLSGGRRASAWCDRFRRVLAAAGWPGERPLSSAEFQTVERFQQFLADFAALDLVSGEIDAAAALYHLESAASEVAFQPEGGSAPVEVMGPLEAAGLEFDAVWIAGMHADAWPQRGQPHPLLPREWQEAHGLPHASAAREHERAARLTAQLLALAPEVVVSAPLEADDHETSSSPLVALPAAALELAPARPLALLLESGQKCVLEALVPDPAPGIEHDRRDAAGRQRGGVRIFADQAACPFRAFARHRLLAAPVEDFDEALDAAERGEFLHTSLEHFWRECRSHRVLAALSAAERKERVARSVAQSAARHLAPRRDLTPLVRRVEERRCVELLDAWLGRELERTPFEIRELESRHVIQRGGVRVEVRIDRVDRLPDGRLVFLDYKSGKKSPSPAWTEQRLEEAQLPLYASSGQDSVAAVAIAALHPKHLGFHGVAAREGILPGIPTYDGAEGEPRGFAELVAFWYQSTLRLAEEFGAGHAAVDPKELRNTCGECDLHALCRIGDRAFLDGGGGDGDGAEPGGTAEGGAP
ncbi:MAG: PD-(D/E)XK nuclease family protein, partial [Planctomycetes bacterium]|nr:PD-(D/E)XK nuclease family protein [Planctomycetota bacterium]